jgi:hypothetical protein
VIKLELSGRKVLDFDIENRPLSYLGQDFTTSEITAIAASFGPDQPMHCWLLGIHEPVDMLETFRLLYDQADMVTGHYIRNHDLPIINGAMLEYGLPPLGPKLTSDTKNDLVASKGVSRSQESISEMLGIDLPKIGMSQAMWRAANRLERLDLTERRVTGDVRQHQAMRGRLLELGMLRAPKMWSAE